MYLPTTSGCPLQPVLTHRLRRANQQSLVGNISCCQADATTRLGARTEQAKKQPESFSRIASWPCRYSLIGENVDDILSQTQTRSAKQELAAGGLSGANCIVRPPSSVDVSATSTDKHNPTFAHRLSGPRTG